MKLHALLLLISFLCVSGGCRSGSEQVRVPGSSEVSTLKLESSGAETGDPEPDPRPSFHTLNINTATLAELEGLPHVGPVTARKIVEYREKNGPFRRAEELLLIRGISDERFRRIRPLVRVQ